MKNPSWTELSRKGIFDFAIIPYLLVFFESTIFGYNTEKDSVRRNVVNKEIIFNQHRNLTIIAHIIALVEITYE